MAQEKLEPLGKVETVDPLEDGKYSGVVIDIYQDDGEYKYIRYKIGLDGKDMSLEVGFPPRWTWLSTTQKGSSAHAKLLDRFEFDKEKTPEITIQVLKDLMLNKKVSFLVQNKETDKGVFANIIRDSVKPSE